MASASMKLIDACELIVDCPHSSAKDEGVGIALIRTPNVGKGRLVLDNVHRVSEVVYQERIARAVPTPGDLILAREAPVGNVAIIQEGQKVCLGQRVVLIRCNKSIAVPDFLVYYLLSAPIQHKLLNQSNETTVAHLNVANIRNLEIDLPSLETQRRIANILSSLDRKIELNNKINSQLEEMAQTLFKHWFVDFGPFKDGKFVESELGMIPEGWRVGTLDEVADIIMGQSPSGNDLNEQGEGLIFYQGCSDFTFRYPSIRVFTTAPTRLAEANSVLFSVRAPVGAINLAKEKCCIGRGIASIRSNNNCDSFVYYLLLSLKYLFDNYNGEGTVFGSINRKTLEGVKIVIPNEDIIIEINRKLVSIDSRIKSLCEENQKLAVLRDTLLPKLMSGEIENL